MNDKRDRRVSYGVIPRISFGMMSGVALSAAGAADKLFGDGAACLLLACLAGLITHKLVGAAGRGRLIAATWSFAIPVLAIAWLQDVTVLAMSGLFVSLALWRLIESEPQGSVVQLSEAVVVTGLVAFPAGFAALTLLYPDGGDLVIMLGLILVSGSALVTGVPRMFTDLRGRRFGGSGPNSPEPPMDGWGALAGWALAGAVAGAAGGLTFNMGVGLPVLVGLITGIGAFIGCASCLLLARGQAAASLPRGASHIFFPILGPALFGVPAFYYAAQVYIT